MDSDLDKITVFKLVPELSYRFRINSIYYHYKLYNLYGESGNVW